MGKVLYAISETTTIDNDINKWGGVRTTKDYMLHAFRSYGAMISWGKWREKEAINVLGVDNAKVSWTVITSDIENGEYPKILTELIKKHNDTVMKENEKILKFIEKSGKCTEMAKELINNGISEKDLSRFIEEKGTLESLGYKQLAIGGESNIQKEVKE